MDYKISVIIPVYNVENYIERCARSLFEQTMEEGVEYIFVNDCTPDRSMQLLEEVASEYPERLEHIQYIHHSVNCGLPSARKSGLSIAKGEFVFQADSDDWVGKDMLADLYKVAEENDADIVRCDFFRTFPTYEEYIRQRNDIDRLTCVKLLLSEQIQSAFWTKLVRRSLYAENEYVVFGSYWEDVIASVQLFYYAKKIVYIPKAYYHYVQYNPNALTVQDYNRKLDEMIRNTDGIIEFLKNKGVRMEKYFNYLKLGAKRGLLFTSDKRSFQRWRQIYPESNMYMWTYPVLPLHLRIVGGCISILPWPLIDLWVLAKKIVQKRNKDVV